MLITFKTRSYANITMFGEVGKKMLEMMDFGVVVPGAIASADVHKALANLQQKLELETEPVVPAGANDNAEARVSLHTRAVPLIALLQSAVEDETHVRWE